MSGVMGRAAGQGVFFDLRVQFRVYILGSNAGHTLKQCELLAKFYKKYPLHVANTPD